MTGTVAQLIALTTYGNSFLAGENIPASFYPDNSTFQFCFEVYFNSANKRTVAPDPLAWFTYLKADGCKKLRLHYNHSKEHAVTKDHLIAGFIGGGGVWLIEAVYTDFSNYWTPPAKKPMPVPTIMPSGPAAKPNSPPTIPPVCLATESFSAKTFSTLYTLALWQKLHVNEKKFPFTKIRSSLLLDAERLIYIFLLHALQLRTKSLIYLVGILFFL